MFYLLRRFLPALSLVVSLFSGCSTMMEPNESSSIGGTGSEVVGVVNYPDSSSAAKLIAGTFASRLPLGGGTVFINPRRYLAAPGKAKEISITETDGSGFFRISNVLPGNHMIYIKDNRGFAVAHLVSVSNDLRTIDLGTLFARKTAGVEISFNATGSSDVLFYIDVLGTGIQLRSTSRNISVQLGNIPTGVDHIIAVRVYRPFELSYELDPIGLVPGAFTTLQAITGDQ